MFVISHPPLPSHHLYNHRKPPIIDCRTHSLLSDSISTPVFQPPIFFETQIWAIISIFFKLDNDGIIVTNWLDFDDDDDDGPLKSSSLGRLHHNQILN